MRVCCAPVGDTVPCGFNAPPLLEPDRLPSEIIYCKFCLAVVNVVTLGGAQVGEGPLVGPPHSVTLPLLGTTVRLLMCGVGAVPYRPRYWSWFRNSQLHGLFPLGPVASFFAPYCLGNILVYRS